jgi:Domain of unknown function (DUF4340)
VTGKAAALQGGLAALGLLTAHLTWQREPERAPGEVTVIEAGKNDLARVHFEDETQSIDLERRKEAGEPGVWMHLVEKPKQRPTPPKPPVDPKSTTSEPTPPPPPEPPIPPANPPRDLRGSDVAGKLLDQFAPLRSPRAFGILDAAKLKELGLDAPTRKLDVTVKGDVRHYDIGQPEKAPGGEAFLKDTRDGRVYLMPRGMLADLQNPGHLIDRRLHGFELGDFDRIVISSGGKSKEYVQTDRQVRAKAALAPAKSPDKPDQMAKNWHDSLWRVFPADILGRDEQPAAGKPTQVLRIEYFDGKSSIGFDEFARAESPSGISEETTATEVYVRTEHTAGWLKVPTGNQLISDAQKLVAAP